ncbi:MULTISPECIES: hypothetical protein [Pseudomonas]|uniref:hypothetical protein n=1 Tax=Pseudomonas TaxID=286 RepID=UPI00177DE9EE|nr:MULTISPECIES: hypothetical protein [Pseudomonas]
MKLTERGHILVEVCLRQAGLKVDGVDMVGRLRRVLGRHSLHVDLLHSYQPHKSHLLQRELLDAVAVRDAIPVRRW